MKLPVKFKTKWVKALRSDKYTQGQYDLCVDDKFCCLGVACDIAGVPREIYERNCYPNRAVDPAYGVLPEILRDSSEIMEQLGSLNDEEVPFEVIAGFINENL